MEEIPSWQVAIFQDVVQVLYQKLLPQTVSMKDRLHGSEHLGIEIRVAQLPISPNDSFAKFQPPPIFKIELLTRWL